jgi:hypothetical protein
MLPSQGIKVEDDNLPALDNNAATVPIKSSIKCVGFFGSVKVDQTDSPSSIRN